MMTTHTLATVFTAYLAEVRLEQQPSTQYFQRRFLEHVLRNLGPLPLADVTPELLRTWRDHLAQRYRPATINRYMLYLRRVLAFAVEQGWLPSNPLTRLRTPPAGPGRARFAPKPAQLILFGDHA